jgi:hypothetical protein
MELIDVCTKATLARDIATTRAAFRAAKAAFDATPSRAAAIKVQAARVAFEHAQRASWEFGILNDGSDS